MLGIDEVGDGVHDGTAHGRHFLVHGDDVLRRERVARRLPGSRRRRIRAAALCTVLVETLRFKHTWLLWEGKFKSNNLYT